MPQGFLNFPFFSMQLENEDRTNSNKIDPILNTVEILLQSNKKKWVKHQIQTDN